MFLGYSEKDESLLRRHNNLTVLDAVSSLDNFMREEVNNQVKHLTLLSIILTKNVSYRRLTYSLSLYLPLLKIKILSRSANLEDLFQTGSSEF